MERGETGRGATALATVVGALDALDDEELRGVIARAQGLLLDRPDPLAGYPSLAVEIVGNAEGDLLAAYRALASAAQRRVLVTACHLAHATATAASQPAASPPHGAEGGRRAPAAVWTEERA